MPEPRRIKKMRDRRFYDIAERQHITLENIATLLKSGTNITVVHYETEKDITTSVLIQVIQLLLKQHLMPELSTDALCHVIRMQTPRSGAAHSENITEELRIVNTSGLMQQPATQE